MIQSQKTLRAHPKQHTIDYSQLHSAIEKLNQTHVSCIACIDASLALERNKELRHCIRLCQDTADILRATADVIGRQTDPDWQIVRAQLQACITAASYCGNECDEHSARYDFCLSCAEACAMSVEALTLLEDILPKKTS
ncbi:MAG: four-helix bundle copper-binding protein [Chitinivibrionales bacterium]